MIWACLLSDILHVCVAREPTTCLHVSLPASTSILHTTRLSFYEPVCLSTSYMSALPVPACEPTRLPMIWACLLSDILHVCVDVRQTDRLIGRRPRTSRKTSGLWRVLGMQACTTPQAGSRHAGCQTNRQAHWYPACLSSCSSLLDSWYPACLSSCSSLLDSSY